MSLFGFSSEYAIGNVTVVDNFFINEFLPKAKGDHVKLYLYGLFAAGNGGVGIDGLSELSKILGMSEEEIFDGFSHLETDGLLSIRKDPFTVVFENSKNKDVRARKKYKPSKYADFVHSLETLFADRPLSENEILEYVDTSESMHISPDALILIARYCIDSRGSHIGFRYILTVARDWAKNGITTAALAERKIDELELLTGELKDISLALGKKTPPDFSDRETLAKWKSWGFTTAAILFSAKRLKNKGNMQKLDSLLEAYKKLNIFSIAEIEEYETRRDDLRALTIEINKKIGVHYELLDNEIETYTVNWVEMGFDRDALLELAQYCFLKGYRRLSDMDGLVAKFYKIGRVSTTAINQYVDGLLKDDELIKKLYAILDLNKFITQNDRETVGVWLSSWGFSEDLILSAAEAARGKTHPIAYLNQILSNLKQEGIYTAEKAREFLKTPNTPTTAKQADFMRHEYSKEELTALFDNIENLDKIEF